LVDLSGEFRGEFILAESIGLGEAEVAFLELNVLEVGDPPVTNRLCGQITSTKYKVVITIGKHAVLAGQAGISGHLTIGDNATIGPQAGIVKAVPENEIVSGTPQVPHRVWLKLHRIFPKLPGLMKMIPMLEKRLNIIEDKLGLSGQRVK